jgi:hypothetical protein
LSTRRKKISKDIFVLLSISGVQSSPTNHNHSLFPWRKIYRGKSRVHSNVLLSSTLKIYSQINSDSCAPNVHFRPVAPTSDTAEKLYKGQWFCQSAISNGYLGVDALPKELSRQLRRWLFGTSTWAEVGAASGPLPVHVPSTWTYLDAGK